MADIARPIPRELTTRRSRGDVVFRGVARSAGFFVGLILFLIGLFLLVRAWPALQSEGTSFLTTLEWGVDRFGIAALLYWTVAIALVALVVAVPMAVAVALFISEYAPARMQRICTSLIDLLAAVPSLIFGIWGFYYLQPKIIPLSRWLSDTFGFIPLFDSERSLFSSSAFIAGIVVSLMVLPITTAVIREVFSRVPPGEKEAALALGATKWGMIRTVVFPFGRGGIVGGAMLGLGRALGETIAVYIIISPIFTISPRILDLGANSIAAHIALRFGEAAADPHQLSGLMAAGLILFLVTLGVNAVASVVVGRSRSAKGVEL